MLTIDQAIVHAPVDVCFRAGADVEGWPDALPHYRYVRFQRKDGFATGRVEMAANRHFGPIPYPVWWVSEMRVDDSKPEVVYRHVDGITTDMDVVWKFEENGDGRTLVTIVHGWEVGPRWPLPRRARKLIANLVIGPVFIHHVASRTLAGIKSKAERLHRQTATQG